MMDVVEGLARVGLIEVVGDERVQIAGQSILGPGAEHLDIFARFDRAKGLVGERESALPVEIGQGQGQGVEKCADLGLLGGQPGGFGAQGMDVGAEQIQTFDIAVGRTARNDGARNPALAAVDAARQALDRKSTRLNSSH